MAEFDPIVQPLNDPSYTRDSRGVDVPRTPGPEGVATNQIIPRGVDTPDRSAEFLGKAAAYAAEGSAASNKNLGDLFAGIVNIADFGLKAKDALNKIDIERQVYDIANQERADYTARLEGMISKAGGKSIFDANAKMDGGQDYDGGEGQDMPDDLSSLPDTLAQLKAGLQAGKISNTYYTGRLLSHAKDIRAKYPGYRQYIDDQFARVTGMNPANARISALTQDINRMQSAQATMQNKAVSEVLKRSGYANGGINSNQMLALVRSGQKDLTDVMEWAYPGDKKEADIKAANAENTKIKGDKDIDQQNARDGAFTLLAGHTDNLMENVYAVAGVKDLSTLRQKLKEDHPPKYWQDVVIDLESARDVHRKRMYQLLNAGGRNSLATRMGLKPGEVYNYIDENIKEFDSVITSVKDKDANGVYGAGNRIKAKTQGSVEFMFKDPNIKEFALTSAAVKEIFGDSPEMAKAIMERVINKRYGGKAEAVFEAHDLWLRGGAVAPPSPNKPTSSADPSFEESFKKLRQGEVLTKTQAAKLVGIVSDIEKPEVSDLEKIGLAHSAYGPSNRKFIGKVDDPWAVFSKWTTDGITKEMRRLSATDFKIWNNYVNFVGETLGSELLSKEFRDLSKIQYENNIRLDWKISDNGVRYIDVQPVLTASQKHLLGATETPRFRQVQQIVHRINQGLYPLSSIAKTDPQIDVDTYIYRTMRRMGFKENQGSGLTTQIINGIVASRTPPKAE